MKYSIIGNKIITAIYFICVTVSAISFSKPYLLFWYLLGVILLCLNPAEEKEEPKK